MSHPFYTTLARWWPLVSPVEDYAEEAAEFVRTLREAAPNARTVLELGSGGGHNAFYFRESFTMTLTDLSAEMLDVSKVLNPNCEHVQGDMRSLDLGRVFDAVFVHDAIEYMTTEADLRAALATAFRHCRPGGVVLIVPDALTETFEPSTDCGGEDGDKGRGVRYLEWTYDPDPTDTEVTTLYTLVTRESDGTVETVTDTHRTGLYPEVTWMRLLTEVGFVPEAKLERTDEDREPRTMFLARRP